MDEKIEEMIDLQRKHCESQRIGDCIDKDCNGCSARAFYNAGYRKESDTAREICLKIIKGQPQPIKEKWVEWFKKEYGVDLGESDNG